MKEQLILNDNELDLIRQWFNAVQDLNDSYLDKDDFVLAKKIHDNLNVKHNRASKAESDLNVLLCCEDCGDSFARTAGYLSQKRTDPLFKWTCCKCDKCKEKRVNLAFKRLPDVMKAIAT